LTPEIKVDSMIELHQVDNKLWRILRQFAPFGPGNMTPIFMSENLRDTGYGKCVGENDKHLRITVTQTGSEKLVCIGFNLGDKLNLIKNKNPFKAVYSIDENHWNGNVSLQLKLRDIRE
jgi:single-stranded-DNA-specific exonuclease